MRIFMKRVFLFLVITWLSIGFLLAQDTILVQTLTFDSISARRGTWDFPTTNNFRKVLMYHTLKCDIQTQHDQYACGEWDYLTYNKVFVHTGNYDSTLYSHPSFTFANDQTVDSVLVSNDTVYNYFSHQHAQVYYPDTLSLENVEVGDMYDPANEVFPAPYHSGRSQYLWKAEELSQEGFTEGLITGIKLYTFGFTYYTSNAMVRMANTDLDEIVPSNLVNDLDTVFFNDINFNLEWNDINFFEPFYWDGSSNIIIDFSYTDPNVEGNNFFFGKDPGFNCGISSGSDNYALDLDGATDFLKLPEDTYFNSDFTFEAWIYKRNNNVWSRVIDFGNGPNKNNVIVVLSNSGNGKFSFHVNNDSQNRSFTLDDAFPTNEWIHLAVNITGPLSRVYINGEFVKLGLLQTPDDVTRSTNYIGRSNWANDSFADMLIDEFRIYNTALSEAEILAHYNQELESPELDPNLLVYYNFNEGQGDVIDHSAYNHHPESYGLPSMYAITGTEIYLGFHQSNIRPAIQFERLESSNVNITFNQVIDSIADSPTQLVLFENLNEPTIPTDTILVWQAGNRFVYENWKIIDTLWTPYDNIVYKEDLPYYGEPFEVLEQYEIGRFITPYGINLDLGPEGFTWVFDVTDYAHLLQGEVDLQAGNQQELIDLKFEFIEGTAPRDVLQIDRVWGKYKSYSYKNLDDDTSLSSITVPLLPEADEFRVKTRLTGHGHNSNTGNYPHCCEWKDNEHYLYVNGEPVSDWHIFQYHDCGLNPVYPQGGTWPGAREGWCPGDLVIDNDFEITSFVSGNEVTLDYGITPVPPDNLGMGNGNYVIAMHLIQYNASNFTTDAEVYDVVTPGSADYYARKNPVCYDPEIIIRNNGTSILTSLHFDYGVSGGLQQTYDWNGQIDPHYKDTIILPVPYSAFWLGDTLQQFNVHISNPNGIADEYTDNDVYQTSFSLPDLFDEPFILYLKTNNQAYRYHLQVRDVLGNIMMEWDNLENNTVYRDTMDFPFGCYTVELIDDEDMGLSYWAYPEQGNGYLRLFDKDSVILKTFDSDFGRSIFYTFNLGNVSFIQESNIDNLISVYPNPFGNSVFIEFNELDGEKDILVYNTQGQLIYSEKEIIHNSKKLSINLEKFPSGLYIVHVNQKNLSIQKKIIKK